LLSTRDGYQNPRMRSGCAATTRCFVERLDWWKVQLARWLDVRRAATDRSTAAARVARKAAARAARHTAYGSTYCGGSCGSKGGGESRPPCLKGGRSCGSTYGLRIDVLRRLVWLERKAAANRDSYGRCSGTWRLVMDNNLTAPRDYCVYTRPSLLTFSFAPSFFCLQRCQQTQATIYLSSEAARL